MISTLCSALFAAAACLALGAMMDSWRSYGATSLALRHRLGQSKQYRELRFTSGTRQAGSSSAAILRPDFRPAVQLRQQPPALHAAA